MNPSIPTVPRSVNDRELQLFLQSLRQTVISMPESKTDGFDKQSFENSLMKKVETLIDEKLNKMFEGVGCTMLQSDPVDKTPPP